MNKIKQIRTQNGATQKFCAQMLGISLRSYIDYENKEDNEKNIKYNYILNKMNDYFLVDENNGVVSLDYIKQRAKSVFDKYNVEFCYLFGSYAKGKAKGNSDIDLLINCKDGNGIKFFAIVEELRESLHKKIDLLDILQLKDNPQLLNEILKDGIKIYG